MNENCLSFIESSVDPECAFGSVRTISDLTAALLRLTEQRKLDFNTLMRETGRGKIVLDGETFDPVDLLSAFAHEHPRVFFLAEQKNVHTSLAFLEALARITTLLTRPGGPESTTQH